MFFPFFFSAQERIEAAATHPVINVAAVVKPRYIQFGEKARLELTISGDTFIKHIKAPKFNFLAGIPRRATAFRNRAAA